MAEQFGGAARALRRHQVEARVGHTRSTIYRWVADGTFPHPIRLGRRSVGWLESEVDAWLAERTTERDAGGLK